MPLWSDRVSSRVYKLPGLMYGAAWIPWCWAPKIGQTDDDTFHETEGVALNELLLTLIGFMKILSIIDVAGYCCIIHGIATINRATIKRETAATYVTEQQSTE